LEMEVFSSFNFWVIFFSSSSYSLASPRFTLSFPPHPLSKDSASLHFVHRHNFCLKFLPLSEGVRSSDKSYGDPFFGGEGLHNARRRRKIAKVRLSRFFST
ncbi:hypothetical protein Csa_022448, partial [Cucumis sativus]